MYRETLIDKMRAVTKKILKDSSIGRTIYPYIQKGWRACVIPARIRRLHRRGYEVLSELHKLLVENKIPYYADCGTLIGFIRDGGFIKHDDDIDIGLLPDVVPPSKVLKVLLDAGWGYMHGFKFEGRFIEFTVKHQCGVTVDVFCHSYCDEDKRFLKEVFLRWYPDRKYPNELANTALKYRLIGPSGITTIKIHNIEVNVPINAKEVLDSEYGPWEHPDPSFKSEMIPHEEAQSFAYRMDVDEALSM